MADEVKNPDQSTQPETGNIPAIDTGKLFSPEQSIPEGELTQEMLTKKFEEATTEPAKPETSTQITGQNLNVPDNLKNLPGVWKYLAEELHSDDAPYSPPEEILMGKKKDGTPLTEKEQYDLFVKEIQQRSEPNPMYSDDPFMLRYRLNRMREDFDPVSFLEQERKVFDTLRMEPKDYMISALMSTGKYTEDAVKDHVGKMNPVEIETMVNKMKQNYIAALQQRDEAERNSVIGNAQQYYQQEELKNQTIVNNWLSQNKNNKKFHGIELGEADYVQFQKELPELLKRDPNTGLTALDSYMQSNEAYLELTPLIWLIMNKKLPGYISNIKEGVKADVEKKAGLTGSYDSGGIGNNGIDVNKLYGR